MCFEIVLPFLVFYRFKGVFSCVYLYAFIDTFVHNSACFSLLKQLLYHFETLRLLWTWLGFLGDKVKGVGRVSLKIGCM